jgi:hypothetical protein
LPKKGASARVAIWRQLRRAGVVPLGNSGYLLPASPENRERFEWMAAAIRSARGEASVLEVQSIDNSSAPQLKRRFSDASAARYRSLLQEIRKLRRGKTHPSRANILRLRQRLQEIAAIDFFASPLRRQVERALQAGEASAHAPARGPAAKIVKSQYRGRVWVTRHRPGVDRVASAWLIKNFIDPKARFAFADNGSAPAQAVPFDTYGGEGFGHRGEDCTFETLVKSFRIRDAKVRAIAEMIHDADLFDEKFGRREGFGVDEIMKGWARQGLSDRALLDRGMQLVEGLYRSVR